MTASAGEMVTPEPNLPELPLEHVLALDLAVAALEHHAGAGARPLVLAPSEAFAREVRTRLRSSEWQVTGRGALQEEGGPDSVIWVAPPATEWQAEAKGIDARLQPGGLLIVIGGGPLALALARFRPNGLALSAAVADAGKIGAALGYDAVEQWRLYGLRSVAWGLLRITVERFGRLDLADRCEAAFQSSLLEWGRPRLWTIGLWVSRKPFPR